MAEISLFSGFTVIAEGVDNREQYNYLMKSGCHRGQGFFLGMPMSAREIEFYGNMDSCYPLI